MGSKSNTFETEFLAHIFTNAAITYIGDASGLPASATAGSLYVRLCTSATTCDDATVGTECAYTGYVPKGVAVARSGAGWTVSGNNASNAAAITFGQCAGGSETVRYAEIWRDNTSTTEAKRLFWGQLTSDLAVSSGITPEFAIGDFDVNED
jgi:hypothetical protein